MTPARRKTSTEAGDILLRILSEIRGQKKHLIELVETLDKVMKFTAGVALNTKPMSSPELEVMCRDLHELLEMKRKSLEPKPPPNPHRIEPEKPWGPPPLPVPVQEHIARMQTPPPERREIRAPKPPWQREVDAEVAARFQKGVDGRSELQRQEEQGQRFRFATENAAWERRAGELLERIARDYKKGDASMKTLEDVVHHVERKPGGPK